MATPADDLTQPMLVTELHLFGSEQPDVTFDGYDGSGNLHLVVHFGSWRSRLRQVGNQAQLVALLDTMVHVASGAPAFTPSPVQRAMSSHPGAGSSGRAR